MILILILSHSFVLCAISMFGIMGNIIPASCMNLMYGKKMIPEMLSPIVSSSSG